MSDLRYRNTRDAGGKTAAARDGKEQLIIFAAVQSKAHINFLGGFSYDCPRD